MACKRRDHDPAAPTEPAGGTVGRSLDQRLAFTRAAQLIVGITGCAPERAAHALFDAAAELGWDPADLVGHFLGAAQSAGDPLVARVLAQLTDNETATDTRGPGETTRASATDPSVLEAVHAEHWALCYALALSIVESPELAREVVQKCVAALADSPELLPATPGGVRSGLIAMTHREVVAALRRREERAGRVTAGATPGLAQDLLASRSEPALADARHSRVRRALGGLPRTEREVILLAYFGGYTQAQIAGRLNVDLATVRARTARGLSKLRRDLRGAAG